jgi:hypothetical protein
MQMPNNIQKSNPSFIRLIEGIQRIIPQIMIVWIFIIYLISSIINIYFLPLPLWISIIFSLIIQISRFLAVFGNFLNPGIYKSNMPKRIALIATIGALIELLFTLMNRDAASLTENIQLYIFFSTILLFGYYLEVHFVDCSERVFSQTAIPDVEVKKNGLNQI